MHVLAGEGVGKEVPGVHQMVYSCLQACDISMRADLFVNIIASGANTLIPGELELAYN